MDQAMEVTLPEGVLRVEQYGSEVDGQGHVAAYLSGLRISKEYAEELIERKRAFMASLTCCGRPMDYQAIFNIRRYFCTYRPGHPAVYVNLATGARVGDTELEVHHGD